MKEKSVNPLELYLVENLEMLLIIKIETSGKITLELLPPCVRSKERAVRAMRESARA